MPDSPPFLEARLGFLLKQAQLRLTALAEPGLAEVGVSAKELVTLALIAADGPETQTRLAERLRIDRTTMVSLLDGLEGRGLVERREHPADRRAHAVEATARGEQVAARGEGLLAEARRAFLAPLTDGEQESLMDFLRRLGRADPAQ